MGGDGHEEVGHYQEGYEDVDNEGGLNKDAKAKVMYMLIMEVLI